ncbi:hypothetical protein ABEY43_06480 [Priestia megaterium]
MTPFQDIYDIFANKITSFKLMELTDDEIIEIAEKYLQSAISYFSPFCNKDLEDKDDTLKQFNQALSSKEKEILAVRIAHEWLNQNFVLSEEFLANHLGHKDYQNFSPANRLQQILNVRSVIKNDVDELIGIYYYSS